MKRTIRRLLWRVVRARNPGIAKLNLGCGRSAFDEYINIDVVRSKATDFVADISDLSFLESDSYEEIRLEAVFEHLWRWQQLPFLRECWRALSTEGVLAINWLPDFERVVLAWQHGEPGLKGPDFDLYNVYRFTHGDPNRRNAVTQVHKDIFTRRSIAALLEEAGFDEVSVENVCYGSEHIPVNMKVRACKQGDSLSQQRSPSRSSI